MHSRKENIPLDLLNTDLMRSVVHFEIDRTTTFRNESVLNNFFQDYRFVFVGLWLAAII